MYLQCNGTLHFLNETKFIWKKYCQFGQTLDRYGVFCLEPFKIAFRHYMYCIQLPLLCHKVWYVCLFSLTCALAPRVILFFLRMRLSLSPENLQGAIQCKKHSWLRRYTFFSTRQQKLPKPRYRIS